MVNSLALLSRLYVLISRHLINILYFTDAVEYDVDHADEGEISDALTTHEVIPNTQRSKKQRINGQMHFCKNILIES